MVHTLSPLESYKRSVFSQDGEDGILERIFEILGVEKGWCVELGAWDGKQYSNTYNLINNKNYSAVMIEGNPNRFVDLKKTYHNRSDIYCINEFVGFEKNNSLDTVFQKTPIPKDFDLLSIDIDGNDYHLWDAMVQYHPKVVIIEYNNTIPNDVFFVQPKNPDVSQGNSLKSLVELGKQKGYELISVTETNGIFVRKELFPLFGIKDNSIQNLRAPSKKETQIFQLYDGTLVISGNKKLLWSGIPILEEKLQIIPKPLRYFQTDTLWKKFLRKTWRFFYTRKVF